jgi:hypothetical protein
MKDIILQNLVLIITGIGISLIGIIIKLTRSYEVIAGYNMMSPEKRKKVNIEQVAIALRNCCIILGLVWIFIPIICDFLEYYEIKMALLVGLHIFVIISLVVIVNTRKKYKNNK